MRDCLLRRRHFALTALGCLMLLCGARTAVAAVDQAPDELARFETALGAEPENLKLAADYRQRVIALGQYDRSIKFLEKLAAKPGAGTNAYLSLALAYVDKVPAAGAIKQLYLGRDAMDALTHALARDPNNLVALYVRGLINLYYDRLVFKRTQKGVDDLEQARRMLAGRPPEAYHARIFMSLGDGYFRLDKLDVAKAAWAEGLQHFPEAGPLKARTSLTGMDLRRVIDQTLDPNTRVDTSLRELFPQGRPAMKGQN